MNKGNAAAIILSVLLALIVRAALETTFKPVIAYGWSGLTSLAWTQVVVFFVLTVRFYLGAFRYGSIEPRRLDFHFKALNFVFAFCLFCVFYATALCVVQPELFYSLIIVLHSVDALWFFVAWCVSWSVSEASLDPDEVRMPALRRVTEFFFVLSMITIATYFTLHSVLFDKTKFNSNMLSNFAFLGALFLLSVIDFTAFHKYYFDHESWVKKHAKSE